MRLASIFWIFRIRTVSSISTLHMLIGQRVNLKIRVRLKSQFTHYLFLGDLCCNVRFWVLINIFQKYSAFRQCASLARFILADILLILRVHLEVSPFFVKMFCWLDRECQVTIKSAFYLTERFDELFRGMSMFRAELTKTSLWYQEKRNKDLWN